MRCVMAVAGAIFVSAVACGAASVTPPDQVAFNYPAPPTEGQPGYFHIAEGGKAKCALIIPANHKLEEVAASQMLETYLKLVTGATFTRYAEGTAPAGLAQIHLGDTRVALQTPLNLPPAKYGDTELPNVNAFLIKTVDPQTLIIRGATPRATLLGAVSLLKRYAGVRRYWPGPPGELGDVVPKDPNLSLPQLEWRDWPYFISRTMSGLDDRGPQAKPGVAASFGDFWRMWATIPSNESYYILMKPMEHLNEPDLFPLINGKRCVPKTADEMGQPCVSNPRVAEIMTQSVREYFQKNPDKFALNVAVNDGYGDCMCEKCRAMDPPTADPITRIGLCDRYVKFDNRIAEVIAKEFPGKILSFLAYGSMNYPPTTVQLNPILMPVLCDGGNFFAAWDGWQKMGAKHMGAYFYHDDIWFIIPKLDIHQSAKRLRYMVGSGVARHFYQEFYGIYPLDGMVGYVEQELIWDPRLDEDKMLEEYYTKFFGPAAGPMKEFYVALEDGYTQWLNRVGPPHPYGRDLSSITDDHSFNQFSVLPVETAVRAQKSLDAALAACEADPLVTKRVKLVATLFDFAVPGARMYWAAERLKGLDVADAAAADHAVADAREAVDNGLALAAYRVDVIEKPEIKVYEDHERDEFYLDQHKGAVYTDLVDAIGKAFAKVTAYQVRALGPEKAETWWREQRQAETRPSLHALMEMAAFDAGGHALQNLVADPSYESRGAKQGPATGADMFAQAEKCGVGLWHGSGSPVSCALTTEDAHTGKYSMVFWATQHACVSEAIDVKPGDRVRMSVWIKQNDKKGQYCLETLPRGDKEDPARTTVNVPWKPGEWQKLELYYVAAPGTTSVSFMVDVDRQTTGARLWVDDFFVGKYPK